MFRSPFYLMIYFFLVSGPALINKDFYNLIQQTVVDPDTTSSFHQKILTLKKNPLNDSITKRLIWIGINNDSIINQDSKILNTAYFFYENIDNQFSRKAVICEKLGFSLYQTKPDSSIYYLKKASDYYKNIDAKRSILCLQNMAFIYDEQLSNFEEASTIAQECVGLWESIDSRVDAANMLKYLGYLNGLLGNFNTAKKQINEAVDIYKKMSNDRGIAVSSLNLAKVHELNAQFDSCILNTCNSRGIWKKLEDHRRLFNVNNYLMKVYLGLDSIERVRNCFEENNLLAEDKNIFWKDELDFYTYASEYFQLMGDTLRLKSFSNKEDSLLNVYQNKH